MNWEIVRNVLGVLFILHCLVLPFVLIRLASMKKQFLQYSDQIITTNKIEKRTNLPSSMMDPFLAIYIFSNIPSEEEQPEIYNISEMRDLKDDIDFVSKFASILGATLLVVVISLVVLLNVVEFKN